MLKNKRLLAVLLALVVLLLLFLGRSLFLVALVNNQPITRFALDRELEKQGGKQVLQGLINDILIEQEAKRQKISVSAKAVDQKLAELEERLKSSGQNLDTLLAYQGLTRPDLKAKIRNQLLLEQMLGKEISISDQEISDYFAKNQASFPKGATLESQREDIRQLLTQTKLNEQVPVWLENLQQKAKIYYLVNF